jgi:penicillin G amidase
MKSLLRWGRWSLGFLGGLAVVTTLFVLYPPLHWFWPPELRADRPLTLTGSQSGAPAKPVEVQLDTRGIPHVFAQSEADLAYGLGVMHARDRLAQLDVTRHLALGRLTELFGEQAIDLDSVFRVVSFRLQEQYDQLGARDRALFEAYAAGVNDGAKHAGQSIEHVILRKPFDRFEPIHALAIIRVQAWNLAQDQYQQAWRGRILDALASGDPRRAVFSSPMRSMAVPIAGQASASAAPTQPAPAPTTPGPTPPPSEPKRGELGRPSSESRADFARSLGVSTSRLGGSNAWAVHGNRTASGHPILSNDPHLDHRLPGLFYIAHLEMPGFRAVGATFPGIPAVLIGAGKEIAWGITSSTLDIQDLYRVKTDPGNPEQYLLDGKSVPFQRIPQTFRLGKAPDSPTLSRELKVSVFGPLMTPEMTDGPPDEPPMALAWTSLVPGAPNDQPVSPFWDLARSRTTAELDDAMGRMAFAPVSMVLALTDGTIAYRLGGAVPRRDGAATLLGPMPGDFAANAPQGMLLESEKPKVTNPESGFIVCANQAISDSATVNQTVGYTAWTAFRARRIQERLTALLQEGKVDARQVLSVQSDTFDAEAKRFAPFLGARCPKTIEGQPPARVQAFCERLRAFDGNFTKDSLGARPYAEVLSHLTTLPVQALLPKAAHNSLTSLGLLEDLTAEALDSEIAGKSAVLFQDAQGSSQLEAWVTRAVRESLELLGPDEAQWRWGAQHRLVSRGFLANVPVIGRWFELPPVELDGTEHVPHAEHGFPVSSGAVLRFVAEMTSPPTLRMVTDTGNSGVAGHPNLGADRKAWLEADPTPLLVERAAIANSLAGTLNLLPGP